MRELGFNCCEIGDEGVAALVDNLGKDDFQALETLILHECGLTGAGCAQLVSVLDNGGLPSLSDIDGMNPESNPGLSEAAWQAVRDAVGRARARRRSVERMALARRLRGVE